MSDRPILVFSRDPGAANHLVALTALLRNGAAPAEGPLASLRDTFGGHPFAIYARATARDVWKRAGIDAVDWDSVAGVDDVAAVLERTAARAVVTGTSDVDETTDCALWRAARRAGLPSLAIVDHAAGAPYRFRDQSGNVAPDIVLVPDDACRDAILGAGVPAERVRVVGDLHLVRVAHHRDMVTADAVARLRRLWGATDDDRVVLFASECRREMVASGRPSPYDEVDLLEKLIAAIAAGEGPTAAHISQPARTLLVVRPHPRDTAGKYDHLDRESQLRVRVSDAGAPEEAARAADLVVGMASTLLLEAHVLGVATLSLIDWPHLEHVKRTWTAAS